jgi:hypothetical protein
MHKSLSNIINEIERIMPSSTPEERIRIYEKLRLIQGKLSTKSTDNSENSALIDDSTDFLPER